MNYELVMLRGIPYCKKNGAAFAKAMPVDGVAFFFFIAGKRRHIGSDDGSCRTCPHER